MLIPNLGSLSKCGMYLTILRTASHEPIRSSLNKERGIIICANNMLHLHVLRDSNIAYGFLKCLRSSLKKEFHQHEKLTNCSLNSERLVNGDCNLHSEQREQMNPRRDCVSDTSEDLKSLRSRSNVIRDEGVNFHSQTRFSEIRSPKIFLSS